MPIITVSDTTALVLTDTTDTAKVYAETYFNHETGKTVSVPHAATPADVVEAYLSI